ncbi:MAG: hypothetical protein HY561_06620 [Gemmatimonadetes bacterium]|nr:hypothetical protein [Gemmatimonadota bacterium]
MRKLTVGLLFLGIGIAGASPAAAQEAKKAAKAAEPTAVSLTGQVIDLSCKVVNGASGPDHRMCAEKCAEMGQPLAILGSDGTVYVPVNQGMGAKGENDRLKPFAEQSVKVKGKVFKRAGVNAILIEEIKAS